MGTEKTVKEPETKQPIDPFDELDELEEEMAERQLAGKFQGFVDASRQPDDN